MVSIIQNIVSLFASSFSDEDHLYFFVSRYVITLLQCPIYVYNDVD